MDREEVGGDGRVIQNMQFMYFELRGVSTGRPRIHRFKTHACSVLCPKFHKISLIGTKYRLNYSKSAKLIWD